MTAKQAKPMPISHQKDLRKGRLSLPNQIYHITSTCKNRKPIFANFSYARMLIKSLKKSDDLNHTKTLAFIVMPDHLHWLLQLIDDASLANVIKSIKSESAKKVGHPIWQPGYYDHAIRKEEDIQAVARYIVANPIRAGLVNKVGDYPHWDAIWL